MPPLPDELSFFFVGSQPRICDGVGLGGAQGFNVFSEYPPKATDCIAAL